MPGFVFWIQESHVFYFKINCQISYSQTVGHDQCSILKTPRHTCFHLILTKIYSRFQMIICHQYTVLWDRKHHLANLTYWFKLKSICFIMDYKTKFTYFYWINCSNFEYFLTLFVGSCFLLPNHPHFGYL